MNLTQRRIFLINKLLQENEEYSNIAIPDGEQGQRRLLRSLMNIRVPSEISEEFEVVQDDYLKEINKERGIVSLADLSPIEKGIYLWRGDITRLACGAIVNAANSGLTGCYRPCHNCIDNCIHTYAGIQLRNKCNELMIEQGHQEPTGRAKITQGYNLPCDYVIHTVGPIVQGDLTKEHCKQLESCYKSCLETADANNIKSIAFCCISTGVFMFPNERAANIAVEAVRKYREETDSQIEVIFNVFTEQDEAIYRGLLG